MVESRRSAFTIHDPLSTTTIHVSMRAWLLDSFDGIDRLRLGDGPDPIAGTGEVVLRVRFAGLNPADRYLAEGQYPAKPKLPHILGRDGCGEVIAVGQDAGEWRVGDRALILRSEIGVARAGTLAEKVAVPGDVVTTLPDGWSEQESAGAPLVYLTAWQALTQWGELSPANILITGASGGVGVASIQLAAAMGHKVIALSRGDSKRDALLKLGAIAVLDPNDSQWRKKCREALGGRVDLAIDNIGGNLLNEVVDVLGENAKVALVGRLAGPVPSFNTASLFFRRIHMRGVFVGAYKPHEAQTVWRQVLATLSKTQARPLVDSVFPFDKALDAFERLRQGPLGKVLIEVAR
jgi:NADPH:quinone reductase